MGGHDELIHQLTMVPYCFLCLLFFPPGKLNESRDWRRLWWCGGGDTVDGQLFLPRPVDAVRCQICAITADLAIVIKLALGWVIDRFFTPIHQ